MSQPLLYCLTCQERSRVVRVRGEWRTSICTNKGCKQRVRVSQVVQPVSVTTGMSAEQRQEWEDEKNAGEDW